MNATQTAPRNATIRRVYCEGPIAEQNRKGEEIPVWQTFAGNEKRQPRGTVYKCLTHKTATGLAAAMAHDRKLELVDEAQEIAL